MHAEPYVSCIYSYIYICTYIYIYVSLCVYVNNICTCFFCTCICICIQKVCDLLVDLNHIINECAWMYMCANTCVWAQACRQYFWDMLLNSLIVSCVHECWICFKTMEHACSNHNLILTLNVHANRYTGAATCIITTSKMLQDMHIWKFRWIYIYIFKIYVFLYIYICLKKITTYSFSTGHFQHDWTPLQF